MQRLSEWPSGGGQLDSNWRRGVRVIWSVYDQWTASYQIHWHGQITHTNYRRLFVLLQTWVLSVDCMPGETMTGDDDKFDEEDDLLPADVTFDE